VCPLFWGRITAVNIGNKIGYPVVIKILSPKITHKSDLGGVIIGINSDDAMRDAYYTMMDNINKKAPHYLESIQGVTVQRQLEKIDYEIILGTKKDKDFGSVIIFGLGGIETEIIKKIAIGLPPMNQTLARRLIEDSGTYEMLQGYRGKKPADMKLLEQAIVSFSNLIVDFPEIGEMEINPLGISNGKPYALDARIILDLKYTESSLPYPHLVITPYPTRHIISWRLTDGREVTLRPIRPEDEPLEHEMLSTLSERTMRERFFSVIKDITHGMLIRFCNIDYDREMAIVAEIKEGNRKRIIGISRLILDSDLKSGEFAVLVHDDFHGKGLGYKLVDMIIGIAQEKGLDNIYGIVLSDNERMLRLCRKLGFVSGLPSSGVTRVTLTLK
jgi:acetyltransferase